MKTLIKRIIKFLGYEIRKIHDRYDYEHEAKEAIAVIQQNTMVAFEPLVTLFQQVRHCEINYIPGDFVECGVWKGGAVGLMALTNNRYSPKRRHLHMFDVFDDICEPDPLVDGNDAINQFAELASIRKESLQGRLRPVKGVYDSHGGHGTVEIVKQLLENKIGYDTRFLHYYEGWFQETLPICKDQIGKIAILRLDADLYASTLVCLQFLYDQVVSGGFVIIDDYGAYEGCRKAVDEFRDTHKINTFMVHVNHDCRYWIKE
jgi:hypothetical protein